MKVKSALQTALIFLFLVTILLTAGNVFAQTTKDRWTQYGNITTPIYSIVVTPTDSTIIYISTTNGTVYKTNDGGYNWNGVLVNTFGKAVKRLVYDPSGTDLVIAMTDSVSVWRNDNGAWLPAWTRIDTGLPDSVMFDIAANPGNLNIIYVSSRGGVFKTTNQGTSWAPVNSGLASDSTDIRSLTVSTVNPNIVYAISSTGKVYRTENAGNTWSYRGAVSGSPTVTSAIVHPQVNNTIYISTNGNYVYKSTDAGASFTQISSGFLDNRVLSIAIDTTGTDRIFAGTDGRGVNKLESPHTTWEPITTGLENGTILSLDVYERHNTLIYAGAETRGFYRYVENHPPVISDIADQRIVADETLQFTVTATDVDSAETQDLHFNVIGLPTGATFDSIGTRVFSWTPDTSQAGYDTVIFKVNDERNGFDYDTVSINVNIRPYIAALSDTSIAEDSLYTMTLSVTDSDGDIPTVTTSTVLPSGLTTTLPTGATYTDATRIFTWTPNYNQAGIYTITFTADDGRGATYSESITITVTNVNQLPYFNPALTQQTVAEGQILNYTVSATDGDGDNISYGTSGGLPSGVHFDSTDTRLFSWIPGYSQSGTYNIALTLNDGKGTIVTDTLTVLVTEVNRDPSISNITTPQFVNVGEEISIVVTAVDADSSDSLQVNVLGRPFGATFESSGTNQKTFSWTPSSNQYGTYNVTFHVQDQSGGTDHKDVTIYVNRQPTLTGPGNQTVNEGDTLIFYVKGSDADGDSLILSVSEDRPPGSTITNYTDSVKFKWITDYTSSGNYSVEFSASDGRGGTGTVPVNITVANVNRAPVLETIGPKTAYIGSAASFYISGTDSDNDNITYSVENLPDGASFNSSTRLFSWTPAAADSGIHYVTFKVTDSHGLEDSEIVAITVTSENRNPVFDPALADITNAKEGQLVSFAVNGRDPDGDAITYGIHGSLPSGAAFDAVSTRKFTWVPGYSSSGTHRVIFKLTDEHSAAAYDTVNITVADVNRAPDFSSMQDSFYVNVGDDLSIYVVVEDPDGDNLTLSGVDLPTSSNFNTTTRYFTWVPSLYGEYLVTFKATDAKGLYSYKTITLLVNREPIFAAIGEQHIKEDSTLTFILSATDEDGDDLTYSLVDELPNGAFASYTSGGISFSWKPEIGTSPPSLYAVTFKVEDYRDGVKVGGEDYKTVKIYVEPFDGNFTPELVSISDKTIEEGKTLMFPVVASDRDEGDSLIYTTGTPLPYGAEYDSLDTHIFLWQPGYEQSGVYTAVFIVTDDRGKFAVDTVEITVIDKNRAPTFGFSSDTVLNEGVTLDIDMGVTDADGDGITVSSDNLPEGASIEENSGFRFIWEVGYLQAGFYEIKFKAADDGGAEANFTFDVYVNNVNRAPSGVYVIYPKNGEDITLDEHLVWTKADEPDTDDSVKYRIEIGENEAFTSLVLWDTLSESRLKTLDIISKTSGILGKASGGETYSIKLGQLEDIDALQEDILYYWRIYAFDNHGEKSAYSTGVNMFYLNLENSPPLAPYQGFNPEINKIETSINPIISWHPAEDPDASDDYSRLSYVVQLDDNQFVSGYKYQYSSETGVSYVQVTNNLTDNSQWYYRIKTVDNQGAESPFSAVIPFYVNVMNQKPSPFTLSSPINKAEYKGETDSVTFAWETTTDPDPEDSFTYTFILAADSLFNDFSIIYRYDDISSDTPFHSVPKEIFSNGSYYWVVQAVDSYGEITRSSECRLIKVTITGIDDENLTDISNYILWDNYPNPFNGETMIKFNLPKSGYLKLSIYNILGQKVRALVDEKLSGGVHTVKWDGRDDLGHMVSSGIYIYIMKTTNFISSKKLVLMK